ncbi:hypothetical protein DM02DRAFT_665174 [Periconia macrospinosa]|uniref:Uncharacterized protein n=1 Tax=Periconia macrospinosa TaxID=97972 RepID=A0A2V1CXB3_9PLEO|nr:hypothetical protein DM02DRAFT_665174 [Periconia macrospinosa]
MASLSAQTSHDELFDALVDEILIVLGDLCQGLQQPFSQLGMPSYQPRGCSITRSKGRLSVSQQQPPEDASESDNHGMGFVNVAERAKLLRIISSSSVGSRGAQIAVRLAVAQTRLDMQGSFGVQTWFGSYAITAADPRVTVSKGCCLRTHVCDLDAVNGCYSIYSHTLGWLPYCFPAFGPASSSNMAAQAAAHHSSPPCDARSSLQAHLALLEANLVASHALWCARLKASAEERAFLESEVKMLRIVLQMQMKEVDKLESCLCGAKKTCGSGMDSG